MNIAPLDTRFPAAYYDGNAPLSHAVSTELHPDGVVVRRSGGHVEEEMFRWPYRDIRIVPLGTWGDPVRLEPLHGSAGEAVVVTRPHVLEALHQTAPEYFRPSPLESLYSGSWVQVMACAAIIVVLASVMYFWGVRQAAGVLAGFLPRSAEQRLGNAVVNTLAPAAERCQVPPESSELLNRIRTRLASATRSDYDIRVIYSRNAMVNAFAAPGGQVVVFSGLLKEAQTPEELAGVLAHEMEHVIHKHATRALAREVSARTLMSMLAVDSQGTPAAFSTAVRLAGLHYRRADEDEADREAVALLARARIDPAALASFFRRLEKSTAPALPGDLRYLSTHPDTRERIAAVESLARGVHVAAQPLLTADQWSHVRENSCQVSR